MKRTSVILLASSALITGCVKQSDFDEFKSENQSALKIAARYNSYFDNPPTFEFHDEKIDSDHNVSAVIRATDERLKGKSVYIDLKMILLSGDTEVETSEEFLYLKDGVGKVDTGFFISPSDKAKIDPSKPLRIKWVIRGWGEMFPAVIEQK
jgi:hypothetical protein